MKPRMENANNATELYSSESTVRFCITLVCQGSSRGTRSVLQERSRAHGTFLAEKRFTANAAYYPVFRTFFSNSKADLARRITAPST
jgi:PAB1-binding protein PBP1